MAALCLVLMTMLTPAAAHSPRPVEATSTPAPPPPLRQATGQPRHFDWLANRPDPALRAERATGGHMRAPGRGSYICSAAGFGEMSRCTER
jgi:hypothetical protein